MRLTAPYLKVVWKLRPASVARVHCDADVAVGVETKFCTFKLEHIKLGLYSANDAQDLLGDDRQHLQLNSVELVKARPGAGRRQSFEELRIKCSEVSQLRRS